MRPLFLDAIAVNAASEGGGAAAPINLNPVDMVLHSTGPVFVVFWLLVVMATAVWAITIMKAFQLMRLRSALRGFERDVFNLVEARDLFEVASRHPGSPGANVVLALSRRGGSQKVLESVARRAIVDEQQRAGKMMTLLASIASSAPFIGLFGTVWGILDAFLRIGREKSASLPVVAPAIGEALITTAVGLFAAIPALIFYNLLNRRLDDLSNELESAADAWVALVAESDGGLGANDKTIPEVRRGGSSRPPAGYAGV